MMTTTSADILDQLKALGREQSLKGMTHYRIATAKAFGLKMGDGQDLVKQHRRSIRLKGYDYRQPGAYFATICTYRWQSLLGEVIDGKMVLNPMGRIVEEEWLKAAVVRSNVTLDKFVIMPNHLHGIILIGDTHVGATYQVAPTSAQSCIPVDNTRRAKGPKSGSLGAIIGQFKRAATLRINHLQGIPHKPVWQRNYYEHVICSDKVLNRIRVYIHYNPARWQLDKYNPRAEGIDDFDRLVEGKG